MLNLLYLNPLCLVHHLSPTVPAMSDMEKMPTKWVGGDFMGFSWQAVLFGIALILVGWVVAASPSSPVWLYPAMGLTFVGGGMVTFIAMVKT